MIEYTVKVDDHGIKKWYQFGELHRIDVPAIENKNGSKEWYIYGERLTEEQFNHYY